MKVKSSMVKDIQYNLNGVYGHNLAVDGDPGKKTMAALAQVSAIPIHWKKDRQLIGYVQHMCTLEDIDAGPIDGYWGPQTEYAYEVYKETLLTGNKPEPWRDDEGIGVVPQPNTWPAQTQDLLEKYYGPVGTNQTLVKVPYPLKIAWKTSKIITKFSCHESVADPIVRVMERVKDHYGSKKISKLGLDLWGGCLNVRKMRGGSKWSTHSWGIAIDWDSARNPLRANHTRAEFAKPVYDTWWKLWEEEGAVSLGRARDYDWMHVQFARVR